MVHTDPQHTEVAKVSYRAEYGRLGTLLRFLQLASFLGVFGAAIGDLVLRWIGHPPKNALPVWFTIICAVVFIFLCGVEVLIYRRGQRRRPFL
jgi:uncharacterized BrkB/YihY/UPF0761 family membrane protein